MNRSTFQSASTRVLPAVAALISLFAFAWSANTLPAALLRASAELGISPQALAGVASAQFFAFVVTTVAAGLTADVIGKKPVFLASCVLLLLGAAACAAARNLGTAYAGGVLMGMGGGVLESMACALLSDLFPARRKLYLNLSQVVYCAGALSGSMAMGLLLPLGVSWRYFFVALSALSAGLLGLYAVSTIPPPAGHERINPERLAGLLGRTSFLVPCLVLFLYVLPESCMAVYVNYYLRQHRAAPENWAIYSLAAVWGAMAVGRLLCALLPERHSYEKILMGLLGASAIALAAQGLVSDWRASFGLFTFTGFLMSGTWPLMVGMAAQRNPVYSGTVVGLTCAAGAMGGAVAAPLMNTLFARLPPSGVFPVLALSLAAACGIIGATARRP
jgi:fucose permease